MSEESEFTFSFQLKGKALEVHKGGEVEHVSEIEFSSPTSKDLKEVSQLKQSLSRALMEIQERTAEKGIEVDPGEAKGAEAITGSDIMSAVAISSEPLDGILEVGRKLLVSGVGKVAGVKFSSTMMQNISCDELERMVGEYCRNFILKSFLES
jgi:hypothetical protein